MSLGKKLLISMFLLVVSFSFVSATCTVTFDQSAYSRGELVTATMTCDSAAEKSTTYTLVWTNQTGTFLFEVSMDSQITGSPSEYTVTAVREFGDGDMEGVFECSVNGLESDTIERWNQKITYPEGITVTKQLVMPGTAPSGQSYTLTCKLGTWGVGNTVTTATTSFYYASANAAAGSADGGGQGQGELQQDYRHCLCVYIFHTWKKLRIKVIKWYQKNKQGTRHCCPQVL